MEVLQTSPLGLLGTAPEAGKYIENSGNVAALVNCLDRGVHAGLSQKARRLLGRGRTDVKARAPFESGDLG
jgi:hypothetical protein